MSRIYPSAINPALREALMTFAKERASHFGSAPYWLLPWQELYWRCRIACTPLAPYEYVDEGPGVTDGKWRITGANFYV